MRWRALLSLVGMAVARDRRGALLSCLGVAAGVACVLFFLAAGLGVGEVVRTKILPADARLVEVVPPKVAWGIFGGASLDDDAVERLAALPGVEAAHRKMQIRVPAISRHDGDFFGKRLRMGVELVGEGVDPGLVEEDLGGASFDDGAPIPLLISPRLLEIYNKSFAKARGLPQLSLTLLRGFELPIEFGRSYVGGGGGGPTLRAEGRLVAVSDRALLQGITVPLETARRLNRHFGQDAATYSGLVLQARDPAGVPALIEQVKGLGFDVDDSERRLSERVGLLVAITTAALSLLGLLVCALASLNIALSLGASVRARRQELGILRALGATPGDLARLVLGEAICVGLAGAVLGVCGAWGMAWGADALAATWLPDFPFKPESFFSFGPWLVLLGLGLGVAASLLGASGPMRRTLREDPAKAIC